MYSKVQLQGVPTRNHHQPNSFTTSSSSIDLKRLAAAGGPRNRRNFGGFRDQAAPGIARAIGGSGEVVDSGAMREMSFRTHNLQGVANLLSAGPTTGMFSPEQPHHGTRETTLFSSMNEPGASHQRQQLVSPPQKQQYDLNESGHMHNSSTAKPQQIISNQKNSIVDLGISVGGGYGELGGNADLFEQARDDDWRAKHHQVVSSVPGNDYGQMYRSRQELLESSNRHQNQLQGAPHSLGEPVSFMPSPEPDDSNAELITGLNDVQVLNLEEKVNSVSSSRGASQHHLQEMKKFYQKRSSNSNFNRVPVNKQQSEVCKSHSEMQISASQTASKELVEALIKKGKAVNNTTSIVSLGHTFQDNDYSTNPESVNNRTRTFRVQGPQDHQRRQLNNNQLANANFDTPVPEMYTSPKSNFTTVGAAQARLTICQQPEQPGNFKLRPQKLPTNSFVVNSTNVPLVQPEQQKKKKYSQPSTVAPLMHIQEFSDDTMHPSARAGEAQPQQYSTFAAAPSGQQKQPPTTTTHSLSLPFAAPHSTSSSMVAVGTGGGQGQLLRDAKNGGSIGKRNNLFELGFMKNLLLTTANSQINIECNPLSDDEDVLLPSPLYNTNNTALLSAASTAGQDPLQKARATIGHHSTLQNDRLNERLSSIENRSHGVNRMDSINRTMLNQTDTRRRHQQINTTEVRQELRRMQEYLESLENRSSSVERDRTSPEVEDGRNEEKQLAEGYTQLSNDLQTLELLLLTNRHLSRPSQRHTLNLCTSLKQQLTCSHLKSARIAAHRTKLLAQNGRLRSLLESTQQKVEEIMNKAERHSRREVQEVTKLREQEMETTMNGIKEELKAQVQKKEKYKRHVKEMKQREKERVEEINQRTQKIQELEERLNESAPAQLISELYQTIQDLQSQVTDLQQQVDQQRQTVWRQNHNQTPKSPVSCVSEENMAQQQQQLLVLQDMPSRTQLHAQITQKSKTHHGSHNDLLPGNINKIHSTNVQHESAAPLIDAAALSDATSNQNFVLKYLKTLQGSPERENRIRVPSVGRTISDKQSQNGQVAPCTSKSPGIPNNQSNGQKPQIQVEDVESIFLTLIDMLKKNQTATSASELRENVQKEEEPISKAQSTSEVNADLNGGKSSNISHDFNENYHRQMIREELTRMLHHTISSSQSAHSPPHVQQSHLYSPFFPSSQTPPQPVRQATSPAEQQYLHLPQVPENSVLMTPDFQVQRSSTHGENSVLVQPPAQLQQVPAAQRVPYAQPSSSCTQHSTQYWSSKPLAEGKIVWINPDSSSASCLPSGLMSRVSSARGNQLDASRRQESAIGWNEDHGEQNELQEQQFQNVAVPQASEAHFPMKLHCCGVGPSPLQVGEAPPEPCAESLDSQGPTMFNAEQQEMEPESIQFALNDHFETFQGREREEQLSDRLAKPFSPGEPHRVNQQAAGRNLPPPPRPPSQQIYSEDEIGRGLVDADAILEEEEPLETRNSEPSGEFVFTNKDGNKVRVEISCRDEGRQPPSEEEQEGTASTLVNYGISGEAPVLLGQSRMQLMNSHLKVEATVIPEEDENDTTEHTMTYPRHKEDSRLGLRVAQNATEEDANKKSQNFKDHLKKRGKSNHSIVRGASTSGTQEENQIYETSRTQENAANQTYPEKDTPENIREACQAQQEEQQPSKVLSPELIREAEEKLRMMSINEDQNKQRSPTLKHVATTEESPLNLLNSPLVSSTKSKIFEYPNDDKLRVFSEPSPFLKNPAQEKQKHGLVLHERLNQGLVVQDRHTFGEASQEKRAQRGEDQLKFSIGQVTLTSNKPEEKEAEAQEHLVSREASRGAMPNLYSFGQIDLNQSLPDQSRQDLKMANNIGKKGTMMNWTEQSIDGSAHHQRSRIFVIHGSSQEEGAVPFNIESNHAEPMLRKHHMSQSDSADNTSGMNETISRKIQPIIERKETKKEHKGRNRFGFRSSKDLQQSSSQNNGLVDETPSSMGKVSDNQSKGYNRFGFRNGQSNLSKRSSALSVSERDRQKSDNQSQYMDRPLSNTIISRNRHPSLIPRSPFNNTHENKSQNLGSKVKDNKKNDQLKTPKRISWSQRKDDSAESKKGSIILSNNRILRSPKKYQTVQNESKM